MHQGKGVTLSAAKVSAVMEAAETWHAETIALPLRLASFAELAPDAADPMLLPRCAGREAGDDRLLWVAAQELMSGSRLWVPHELVTADFTYPAPPGAGLFQATTNGLASGNHWLEAVLHGLYEVVERDAIALWRAASDAAQNRTAVDLDSVEHPSAGHCCRPFAAPGVAVRVWDVASDIRLPISCVLRRPTTVSSRTRLRLPCRCGRRAVGALTEAAQARLTRISGARDDFAEASIDPPRVPVATKRRGDGCARRNTGLRAPRLRRRNAAP